MKVGVPRCSLQPPSKCAWRILLNGRNDGAMITLTGLDFSSFEELHEKFKPFFNKLSLHRKSGVIEGLQPNPKRRGRKQILTSRDGLALTLAWTRTRGSMFVLQMIFGLTYTAVGVYVNLGRRLLVSILEKDDNAKVSMIPSDAKIQSFKNYV